MRAGLSTIQQTLTPEAATVLNHSISEASRRNHGQTTPLHVAATLLSSPTGYLRQACIKSHPNSSHPLQCRALELCFSVALERLPTSQNPNSNMDPPISNALMAALKRAQAHQRRGCPEQQQQPLLAVKVELEQLIISILDDPSVSRVMREASFSSPAVKATIEQSLIGSQSNSANSVSTSASSGLGFRAPGSVPVPVPVTIGNRSLYLNPRLQQGSVNGGVLQSGQYRGDEVKRVLDILVRSKKKNPILVGESEPEVVVKEVLRKVGSKEIGDGLLRNVEVIHLEEFLDDKGKIAGKIADLSSLVEARIKGLDCGGVVVDLGDLKWLVEQPVSFGGGGVQQQPQQQVVSEAARAAVAEMGKLLGRFGDGGGGGRVWLIGTATCETYLRCQVYHPSMENDWDLQAVPIAPRAPTGAFPRLGNNGILSSSVESLSPLKNFPSLTAVPTRRLTENLDPARRNSCCPQCMQNYEQDLAKSLPKDSEKSSEVKSEPTQPSLPLWLKNAKFQDGDLKTSDQTVTKDQELTRKQKTLELQKKWHDTCMHLHPGYHQNNVSERLTQPVLSMTSLYNPNLVSRQPFLPKAQLERNLAPSLQMNSNLPSRQPPAQVTNPPGSPVRTDLVLGRPKIIETIPEKVQEEQTTKDFLGCVPSEPQTKLYELQTEKCSNNMDSDSFKKLLKGLAEKVWWQREAASAVATTVTNCKLGIGRRRGAGTKGDTWLLFTGPDRVGKKKMASALSNLVCGTNPVIVYLGTRPDDRESDTRFRGKTALDRIAEAVRRNPFSVIVLEDVDEADLLVRGSIRQAMERGRLADSHGREISLGNIIFILTANWLPENLNFLSSGVSLDEKKLHSLASGGWQLRLTLSEKTTKRRASWSHDEDRPIKSRTESGLSFDLNEAADADDDKADGSHNSSDLTIDHEDEHVNKRLLMPTTSSVPRELLNSVDDSIVFKPVDFSPLRRNVSSTITKKFSTTMGERFSIEIQHEALEKILAGTWIGQTGLEEWSEKVLVPSLHQLKSWLTTSSMEESMVVRLELDNHSDSRSSWEWLPSNVKVSIEGL